MSTIQIRIDEKDKKEVRDILNNAGLDFSSAVKMYFRQIRRLKGIPFMILTENGLTPKQEQEILKASRDARSGKNVTKAMSPAEAIKYLKSL